MRRRNTRRRRREHERPRDRVIVQVWPRSLDLFQLAQTVRAKVADGEFIVRPGRVYAELPVEQRPREPKRTLESERAIGEPQVQIESERRPLHRAQGVQVDRDRAADDLVEEVLTKLDPALP